MNKRLSTVCRLIPFLMYGPVLLHGLSNESLNGLQGTTTEYDQSTGRYVVKFTPYGKTEEALILALILTLNLTLTSLYPSIYSKSLPCKSSQQS